MKRIIVVSLVLVALLAGVIVPVKVFAQDYGAYADISGQGTSASAGEAVKLRVTVKAKQDITDVKVTISELAPELVLIQRSAEVSLIQSGEERVISIPLGTSTETPEGKYRISYYVTFHDGTGKEWATGEQEAFVRVEEEDEGCFIATAAYGTDTAQELDILREFRDKVLLPDSLGIKFVFFYYRTSPPIAEFISRQDVLRTMVREVFVAPIVAIVNLSHNLWSE